MVRFCKHLHVIVIITDLCWQEIPYLILQPQNYPLNHLISTIEDHLKFIKSEEHPCQGVYQIRLLILTTQRMFFMISKECSLLFKMHTPKDQQTKRNPLQYVPYYLDMEIYPIV